jgi:hypothetical protein
MFESRTLNFTNLIFNNRLNLMICFAKLAGKIFIDV